MGRYLLRRFAYMIPTVFLISLVSFAIIQLPPGDYLTTVVANLSRTGQTVDPAQLAALKQRYALDQPLVAQYAKWISNIVLHGDFGQSFEHGRSVASLLAERLPLTLALGIATFLFTWAVALPAGIYSAVRKYSVGDYLMTAIAFVGIAVPGFLLALTVAYIQFRYFDKSVGGLLSPDYVDARWNLGKILDLLDHLWLPIVVLSLGGIGGTIRVLRANLLDELRKPYVVTGRARGLSERKLIANYPVRVALNPFIATIGWLIPALFDGEVLVATVLGLQTTGPLLLGALQSQDMYLAGSIIFIACVLTVIGTLISDILLALVDPRIREGQY
ncbi:ABC transporter permease [Actinopolymorpha singaporensis]|uniref:Peptide/nickel transport system permease protein n=1 Tax=Actinopolymorpha singaporensis TaxID=117157 RepID=A0A1H1UU37_9ACTN|nr:ABC transporter permease [Actinopolymorpha singaporensis]SDS75379.1 peptide/nickel transport system permease protein [Actinopolymorpha singaporensis]